MNFEKESSKLRGRKSSGMLFRLAGFCALAIPVLRGVSSPGLSVFSGIRYTVEQKVCKLHTKLLTRRRKADIHGMQPGASCNVMRPKNPTCPATVFDIVSYFSSLFRLLILNQFISTALIVSVTGCVVKIDRMTRQICINKVRTWQISLDAKNDPQRARFSTGRTGLTCVYLPSMNAGIVDFPAISRGCATSAKVASL